MRWPWSRAERRNLEISISDPVLADYFGFGGDSAAGVHVNEGSALGLSAVYRAVSLISGTIASLPLRTLRTVDDQRERAPSFLDAPDTVTGMTAFEWKEIVLVHLLLHGETFLMHVFNGAGSLAGLHPIHPSAVFVEEDSELPGGKRFTVTLDDGTQRVLDARTMTHIPGLTLDGIRGLSPIRVARNSLGTAIAGDRSAARMFANGALMSGIVTPEEDVTEAEAREIKDGLRARVLGQEHAGDVAVINRKLKFSQWSMSAEDAQFMESRAFQIEEIGRWYGVPPHLLGQSEKSTSWGTGITEQNRGLARHTLMPWTRRIEERLSRLLPSPRFVEFDYSQYLQPSPEDEVRLLIEQVDAGLLTLNEARRVRNLPAVEGGDTPRGGSAGSSSSPPGADAPGDEEDEDDA